MLGGISACGQLTFNSRLGKQTCVRNQSVDVVDTIVEVELDFVEVTVVSIGDLWRDIALADAVDIFSGHIERADHRIETIVDSDDDLLEVPLMFGSISAGG